MSEKKDDISYPMDSRCPLKLECQPTSWCPLAVLRLKALRNAGGELTEEEEDKLPGCQWAVNHQMANYCFFNYITQFLDDDSPPSDTEIAHLMNISVETVKKIQKTALEKIRDHEEFRNIRDMYGGEAIMVDGSEDDPYQILR